MSKVYSVAKNSVISVSSEIVNKLISLVLTILIARYLGDAGFGQYSFIITMMMLFQIFSDFGLDNLTIREIAKDPGNTRNYTSSILLLKLAMSLANLAVLSVLINLMNKPYDVILAVYVGGASIIFFSLANSFSSVFNAHERLDLKAFLILFSRTIVFMLTIWAIYRGGGLLSLIFIILTGEIIRLLLGWYLFSRLFGNLGFKFDYALCRRLLKMSFPFALISAISLIYFKIDIIMLSLMKGDQAVGWYSAAYGILAALPFVAEAYNLSIYPLLSREDPLSSNLFSFSWQRSVKYLIILSLPISVGTTIIAEKLINLIYSQEYNPSITAIRILIWTLPWIFANSINMKALYATNKQNAATIVAFFSMVINILLNLVLIPRYSYMGAAVATVAAEMLNVIMYFWIISSMLKLRIDWSKLLPPAMLASAAMGTVIWYLRFMGLSLLIPLGAITYLLFLFIFRAFDEEDKMLFKKIIFRSG